MEEYTYNWQREDWTNFTHNYENLGRDLIEFGQLTGKIDAKLDMLGKKEKTKTIFDLMVLEAIKTSEIEGLAINKEDIESSVASKLNLKHSQPLTLDKRADGVVSLIFNARETFNDKLTEETLSKWHYNLTESGHYIKNIGRYRDTPMFVVSGGRVGKETIEFEAPPSKDIPKEMKKFINWFNNRKPDNPIIRAAIVHHYFVSIHPYEDGNGRMARALTEKALSQGLNRPVVLSLSETINHKKINYYAAIKESQKTNNITPWIKYFSNAVIDAHKRTEKQIQFTIDKAHFFENFNDKLNNRQLVVLKKILQTTDNAERGLSNKRYKKIADTNRITAGRDLADLVKKGIIIKNEAGGRSIAYTLNMSFITK